MKLVALSIPMKVTDIAPEDIGAMAQLFAGYLENLAAQLVSQGAPEDVARTMQVLTMYFMNQSARAAIFATVSEEDKKAYEKMEELLLKVVNTPDHELGIIEKKDDVVVPNPVDITKH